MGRFTYLKVGSGWCVQTGNKEAREETPAVRKRDDRGD